MAEITINAPGIRKVISWVTGGNKTKPTATDAVVSAAVAGGVPGGAGGNLYTPDSLNLLHSLPNLMNQLDMENNAADDDLYL